MKRALVLHGGWEGHQPDLFSDFAIQKLLGDHEVIRSTDLEMLCPEVLENIDLLLPIWTFGVLSEAQEQALLNAVANGMGVVAWHGATSAFLSSRPHKFLLGGQFVAHPGGEDTAYTVRFLGNDPLVEDLADISVVSEQYYLLVDPAVKVLATTVIDGADMPWLAGVNMPSAWTRQWGRGRVFYCALGHSLDILEHPSMTTLLRRAIDWAARAKS